MGAFSAINIEMQNKIENIKRVTVLVICLLSYGFICLFLLLGMVGLDVCKLHFQIPWQ